jgi:hypothetical protein
MNLFNFTRTILFFIICTNALNGYAQVAVNNTGTPPNASAVLDVNSSSKGMLIPRMTTPQRMAIANPANGLMVFDTDRQSVATYTTSTGWSILVADAPGRIYLSDHYPDTLYPDSAYEYLGYNGEGVAVRNLGILPGGWVISKAGNTYLGLSFNNRQFCYTGLVGNKILGIGPDGYSDSAITVYSLATDSVYRDPAGSIYRGGGFTATIDTANARIFIYGGVPAIQTGPPPANTPLYNPQYKGVVYYYNTGVKVLMDSASSPVSYKRDGHFAVWASGAGKLFVWGGYIDNPYGFAPNILMAYNPAANSWSSLAACPLSLRYAPFAVYDGNDRILVWGGYQPYPRVDYTDGAIYTISTNTWTMMSSTNAPTKLMGSVSWAGTEMMLSSVPNTFPYEAYRYNPNTNVWAKLPGLPLWSGSGSYGMSNHVSTSTHMVQAARLTAGGGFVLWKYDLAANTWTPYNANDIVADRTIQAGNVTVLNGGGSYTSNTLFLRFNPNTSGPSYAQMPIQMYYFKKR